MSKQSILFIGHGKMGEAILNSIKTQKHFDFFIIDPSITPKQEENLNFYTSIEDIPESLKFSYSFLATKPQIITEIAKSYIKYLSPNTILISILAGKSTPDLANLFGETRKIVRLMPNLAAKFSHSTTTGFRSQNITDKELIDINALCSQFGSLTWLENEELMHISTAINGSSPAFFAYIVKAFTEHAEKHSLDQEQAQALLLSTMENTIEILRDGTSCTDLMKQVASKAGTTEAMLDSLKENQANKSVIDAIESAVTRSKSL